MLILATNLLLWGACFLFLYQFMENILQEKYEEANIKRFEQAEININTLSEQIEIISLRLSSNNDMNSLAKRTGKTISDQTSYLWASIKNMEKELMDYSYIRSIILYGKNGEMVVRDKLGYSNMNYFYEKEKLNDNFGQTDIYDALTSGDKRLYWFGGYNMEDLGVRVSKNHSEEESLKSILAPCIVAGRSLGNGFGQVLVNVSIEYFNDLFDT